MDVQTDARPIIVRAEIDKVQEEELARLIGTTRIAQQLGHSVQMLLDNYAKWANSDDDWGELAKLKSSRIGTKLVQPISNPEVSA